MTLAVKVAYSGRWVGICRVDGLVNEETYVYKVYGREVYVGQKWTSSSSGSYPRCTGVGYERN